MSIQSAAGDGIKKLSAGTFIVVEGLDGSGGTTQIDLLARAWGVREPTREIVVTREPSDGVVGRWIRTQLGERGINEAVLPYLFAADRRDHLDRVVLPALDRGAVVLSDRYLLSSLAYQSAAAGIETVLALNAAFPAPTLTVLLDLAPEACLARIERRGHPRDHFETLDRLRVVADGYERAIASTAGWPLLRVDASEAVETVHTRITAALWPT